MRTLTHTEIENVALKVAAILKTKVDGDPTDPDTWMQVDNTFCHIYLKEYHEEHGFCRVHNQADDCPVHIGIGILGTLDRPMQLARVLIHEISHAVLIHYAPTVFADCFQDALWAQIDYAYQANENICRAVERYFLSNFGHGWLPTRGYYWN